MLVFRGRYDILAKHLLNLRNGPARDAAEVERFLRRRLVPILGDGASLKKKGALSAS
jgi:hypothetical protein